MDIFIFAILIASTVAHCASIEKKDDSKIVRLESYNVDPTSVSVSGISSGGSFTSNFLMAHSSFLKGGGTFAGGAYRCGNSSTCGVEDRINNAIRNAEAGLIDPIENIQDMPVYVFAGGNDSGAQRSGPIIEEFFETLGGVVDTNFTNPCGHGVPSLDSGIDCPRTWVPGVNNCGWSGAYHVMNHVYGDLAEPTPHMQPLQGDFMEFDQTEFTRFEISAFAPTGYVYVPSGCRDRRTACRLHVNVHGCFILSWVIGDKYARLAGHNEVGELNDIIILHPMLTSSFVPPNVFGCWSSGSDRDTNENVDIRVVMKMINRILGSDD